MCTYPYCGCWTDFPANCIQVSTPVVIGQTFSFTISSQCAAPLGHSCSQDLHKIEFNSCECTPVFLWSCTRHLLDGNAP